MIAAAIGALKERSGSSRQAILKYVTANYKVGDEKLTSFHLKLALKRGVTAGTLKVVKGTGASGSFKLANKPKEPKKKPAAKKPATPKKKAAKKAATPKKKTAKKAAPQKKTAAKKTPKRAAKKPATKKAAAKKAAPKKKTAAKKAKKGYNKLVNKIKKLGNFSQAFMMSMTIYLNGTYFCAY